MVMKKSRAKSLWSWNSSLSIGFDVIFGVIPAVLVGFYGITLGFIAPIGLIFVNSRFQDVPGYLGVACLGLGGFLACTSLIWVTFRRTKIKLKTAPFYGLWLGFVVAFFILIWSFSQPRYYFRDTFMFFALLSPVVVVAIKHIIMLSRANSEVQP